MKLCKEVARKQRQKDSRKYKRIYLNVSYGSLHLIPFWKRWTTQLIKKWQSALEKTNTQNKDNSKQIPIQKQQQKPKDTA